MSDTPTPRTDSEVEDPENMVTDWFRAVRLDESIPRPLAVNAEFARELERELAEARKLAEEWRDVWRHKDLFRVYGSIDFPWEKTALPTPPAP